MEAVRKITTGSSKNRTLPSKSISDCGKSYVTCKGREGKKTNDVHMIGNSWLLKFPSPSKKPTAGAAAGRLEVKLKN